MAGFPNHTKKKNLTKDLEDLAAAFEEEKQGILGLDVEKVFLLQKTVKMTVSSE